MDDNILTREQAIELVGVDKVNASDNLPAGVLLFLDEESEFTYLSQTELDYCVSKKIK